MHQVNGVKTQKGVEAFRYFYGFNHVCIYSPFIITTIQSFSYYFYLFMLYFCNIYVQHCTSDGQKSLDSEDRYDNS